jgi:lipoprotein-anchoring transpeptidase ErfK/SrfK
MRFKVTAGDARLTADVDAAMREALRASRRGWFVGRTLRGLLGDRVNAEIALPVSYSHQVVRAFVTRLKRAIDRPARDASVSVAGAGALMRVASLEGAALDAAALRAGIERALQASTPTPVITAPVRELKPHRTNEMLAAEYPAYIVIDRPAFTLRLYERLRLTRTYSIAVGRAGLETPSGVHRILDKQVNPAWHVPHSAWAGTLAGKVIPPGPQDPLVARWMAIDDQGDGIHGTNEPASIGSAASHGCIRMLVPDVIELYRLTPLGTPVYVV